MGAKFWRLAVAAALCTAGLMTFGLISFHLVERSIVPIAGVLIFLFTLEQLVCGWQNGFAGPEDRDDSRDDAAETVA